MREIQCLCRRSTYEYHTYPQSRKVLCKVSDHIVLCDHLKHPKRVFFAHEEQQESGNEIHLLRLRQLLYSLIPITMIYMLFPNDAHRLTISDSFTRPRESCEHLAQLADPERLQNCNGEMRSNEGGGGRRGGNDESKYRL